MSKSSVYFSPPPFSVRGPLISFTLATALLIACGYLVPTVFIETGHKNFSNTSSDMNVFLPSTAFAFSCLEKTCFFRIFCCKRKYGLCFVVLWLLTRASERGVHYPGPGLGEPGLRGPGRVELVVFSFGPKFFHPSPVCCPDFGPKLDQI